MPRYDRDIVIVLDRQQRLELEGLRRQAETTMYNPSASSQECRDARLLERRIRIVLRASAGDSVVMIAKTAPYSKQHIARLLHAFLSGGLPALQPGRPGRKKDVFRRV